MNRYKSVRYGTPYRASIRSRDEGVIADLRRRMAAHLRPGWRLLRVPPDGGPTAEFLLFLPLGEHSEDCYQPIVQIATEYNLGLL